MTFYRRRLPHWQPEGKALFLTWHLHGSLPHNRFPPPGALSAGKAFVWMDRFLDQASFDPTWLERKEIAKVVVDAIHYTAEVLHYYDLARTNITLNIKLFYSKDRDIVKLLI